MTDNAPCYVLDSFALLAFLQGEPGKERVKTLLQAAGREECQVFLSWINLGEILYIVEREKGFEQAQIALGHIQALPIQLLEATPQAVLEAAHLKARYPLAYADAFALAAALEREAILVTGDPEFRSVEVLVRIEWLP